MTNNPQVIIPLSEYEHLRYITKTTAMDKNRVLLQKYKVPSSTFCSREYIELSSNDPAIIQMASDLEKALRKVEDLRDEITTLDSLIAKMEAETKPETKRPWWKIWKA